MSDYSDLLNAVAQYYGSGSDEWEEIAKYGIASHDASRILKQVPGVEIWVNSNGSVRSYNYTPIENITSGAEQAVNSNVPAVVKSFEIPSNSGIETITSETGETVKQMTFKSGMKQAGSFVFGEIAPRVAAVSAGITLGKFIDKAIYSFDPNFFDEHGMETLNPDKWGEFIGTDSAGSRVLNVILGTTPSGETQAYIDQDALAYMSLYLQIKGLFSAKNLVNINNDSYKSDISRYYNLEKTNLYRYETSSSVKYLNYEYIVSNNSSPVYYMWLETVQHDMMPYFVSKSAFTLKVIHTRENGHTQTRTASALHTQKNNKDIYYMCNVTGDLNGFDNLATLLNTSLVSTIYNANNVQKYGNNNLGEFNKPYDALIYYMLIYGGIKSISDIPGIGTQDGAKTPILSDDSSVEDALNALKEQFPELWDNAVEQDVVQPDGTVKTYVYVPAAMPDIDENGNPISSSSTQADPQVQPETATKTLLDLITKIIQRDPPVNPPDTGDGVTPVVPPATGSASSLYAIYNPTLAQINSFGAWLWSDNFVDQIKKLFNDPMQAIIGLHKVYATPATGGAQTIKVGYLDSGVSAKVVSNQYTTIDCGTVRLSEQFHNVFDYSPYTEVNLYLPFIGIVNINVADVMRSSIHIVYHVDVLSGACLAEVKVTRDSAGGTLYQYAGNASVTLPISSGSYMGIVSAVAGIAGGIAGTIASGGAALPLLASSAGAMFNAHTRVEHSGGFSGNAGAMGGKIPYLIISRPQTEMADGFENYIGYPSNFTATIGSCTGFIKVIECHVENATATNSELTEINTMLQEGVIV